MELTSTQRLRTAEEEAARIVNSGQVLARAWLGLKAGIRLLLDPDDTQQVFLLAAAVDRPRLSAIYRKLAASVQGRALLERRPAIDGRSVDFARLRRLPASSLGGAYARSLAEQNLDPDVFQPPPGLPPELAYVAQRLRQTHDLWHVLTGLPTDIPSEIALQAFSYAQIRGRTSFLIALFGALFYGFRYAGLRRFTRAWYQAGAEAVWLPEVHWEELWEVPVAELRARFRIATYDPASPERIRPALTAPADDA